MTYRPTRHVRLSASRLSLSLSLSLSPSPSFTYSLSLSLSFSVCLSLSLHRYISPSLSEQNIESRYLRFPVVSRPRRSRVRNVRHGHATCVRVITRSQSLSHLSRLRERISGTLAPRTRYYAASRHVEIIHLSCNVWRIIIYLSGDDTKKC